MNFTTGANNLGGASKGGDFDLLFNFSTSNPGQLAAGKSSEYTLSGTNLSAAAFTFLDAGDINNSAVHVQGASTPSSYFAGTTVQPPIVPTGIPVPEPTSVALLGLGLLGLLTASQKKRKQS